MKKLFASCLIVLCLLFGCSCASAANDQDLESLSTDELQELIVQSLLELCSREECSNDVVSPRVSSLSMFGSGAIILFRDSKSNYHYFRLTEDDIDLQFKTTLEQIIEQAADIELTFDQDSVDQAVQQIEETQNQLFP